MHQPRLRRGRLLAAAGALSLTLVLAACGDSGSAESGGGQDKDTITYALPPNATPNWILPMATPEYMATHNTAIKWTLWTPVVNVNGADGEVAMDAKGSLAESVEFSGDGRTATITLKDMSWNDGTPVSSRDVEFWFNLIKANKAAWGGYSEGRFPDNVAKWTVVDDKTFEITFDKVYNENWLLNNQLVNLYAIPQHAWDKTGDDGEIGDHDRTPEGAKQVWDYLIGEAKQTDTYATNPLWQVVNGPYTIEEWTSTGQVTLAENPEYDGDDPAHIPTVVLQPFTSADAELNALRSGEIDYGYLPASAIGQQEQFEAQGYRIDPWHGWAVTYMPYNFNNPDMGPVFRQLYARQAIQHSIDQKSIAEVIWHGTAEPTYGPIPQTPSSEFLSEAQKSNPYPFDTDEARRLLEDNGWTIGDDGIAVCENPGTGQGQCGEGIEAGKRFEMNVLAQSGSNETDNMMAEIKSSLESAGIALNIQSKPLNQVLGQSGQCTPDQQACSWQLSFFGTQGSWYFNAYPTGERLFGTGGTANFGSYSNAEADRYIQKSLVSNDQEAIRNYSELLTKDLPVVWLPEPAYQVSAIREGLQGTGQDPLAEFFPQRWSWGS
ncbi:peptide/nickel transport system substrate-binding protein [Haloactinopolyspora alba]|uniref:Peptide/nickel transport system substrate-binding protein n=1 Tax=Haloactinopolyspora alba TaxID=648780 RepID=A0A2P8DYD4_9ACTN|nr:peptide ABC transporter substrate-binding protein [Haloactinopolyspora alba]PSL02203.1 peptide/nickel transport system substrate-binding protein [Haloactinopolyspora alba]